LKNREREAFVPVNTVKKRNELEIPPQAFGDPDSMELIRVWMANKNQHFTLRVGLWDDPAAWGLLLADLARNVAQSYEQENSVDVRSALDRIRLAFNTEIQNPTDN
jgi:hypothetical protein